MKIQIKGWYERGKQAAKEEGIPIGDRIFDMLVIFISIYMIIFLSQHLTKGTGFITKDLTYFEYTLLYGFWITWIITASLQTILGQKFLSRKFDVFGGIPFLLISSVYFTLTFPFDFRNFTEELPGWLNFLGNFITNTSARAGMGVVSILLFFGLVYSPIAYRFVVIRRENNVVK